MEANGDFILLKWGTIKGWSLKNSPEAFEAIKEWASLGRSMSVMMQNDTKEQKELILKAIDNVNGIVQNDWTGEIYNSKDSAKKYIKEYKR